MAKILVVGEKSLARSLARVFTPEKSLVDST